MADFNRNRSFGKNRGGGRSNFRRRSGSSRPESDNPNQFSRNTRSFAPRESGKSKLEFHTTTCAKCGDKCEVPFKPNNRKPVYCSDCFRKSENGSFERDEAPVSRPSSNSSSDLRQINEKLDRILSLLEDE